MPTWNGKRKGVRRPRVAVRKKMFGEIWEEEKQKYKARYEEELKRNTGRTRDSDKLNIGGLKLRTTGSNVEVEETSEKNNED